MSRLRSLLQTSLLLRPSFMVGMIAFAIIGCRSTKVLEEPPIREAPVVREIETANVCAPVAQETATLPPPLTINSEFAPEDWHLTLEEVVRITMSNSDVIRDIGGSVVNGAGTSVYDVALQQLGEEEALSAFDAQVNSNIFFNRDERAFNNIIFGGGASTVAGNSANSNFQISKTGATGTQYQLRTITSYNRDSAPSDFNSAHNVAAEAQIRQPLLRGRGIEFNRLAGPNAQNPAATYNGVVLARIRTDIALADFESSVRNLVRDTENAYWQLYFAYRSLDARTAAYEAALRSWRTVQDQLEAGTADGEQEALARATFYQTKVAMNNALAGGVGVPGVHSAERNLRKLMGIPANDGKLIRPADEPSIAERIFDWQDSLDLALDRRVELRRQRWLLKQRESELIASKNFLLSQIDLVGLYRWRGFGDDLLGNRDVPNGSAISDLWTGDLQGWQLGLEYSVALGKRREHAVVRGAELRLARERAQLRNKELLIGNDLSSQFGEMARTYAVARDNFNRTIAERTRLKAAQAKYDAGQELLEFVLNALQSTADADSQYFQTLVDYNLAVSNMHFVRGTYLDYMGVRLSEGPWSAGAYRSYAKEFRRFKPRSMNYCKMEPSPVSSGSYSQVAPITRGAVQHLPAFEEIPAAAEPIVPVPADLSAPATLDVSSPVLQALPNDPFTPI